MYITQHFDKLDKDGDGFITKKEFVDVWVDAAWEKEMNAIRSRIWNDKAFKDWADRVRATHRDAAEKAFEDWVNRYEATTFIEQDGAFNNIRFKFSFEQFKVIRQKEAPKTTRFLGWNWGLGDGPLHW